MLKGKIQIKDIAVYLPENVLTNEDLSGKFPEWSPQMLFDKLGIKDRHIAGCNETAVDMAVSASEKLFTENPELRTMVDFIILCTQSPDFALPASSCILQERLGLKTSCGALDINQGCSGFIYGLAISKGLIQAGIARNILFITSETYTKLLDPDDKSTRTIFGDGAAAVWICKSESHKSIGEFILGTDGRGSANLIVPGSGQRAKCGNWPDKMFIHHANTLPQDRLYMNGPEIFNFTLKSIPPLIADTLKKNDIPIEGVDYFIFHQANKYMLEHLQKKLKIPKEKFYIQMEEVGNTVSATVPIALWDAQKRGLIKEGYKVMLVGFGVGYSWGACLIQC
ncbi:MAG: ketoacyl-ACP synthase III [Clostridia bacterium]|nr:ketoacyl-ACP synthase III [Clostridia bacterium]